MEPSNSRHKSSLQSGEYNILEWVHMTRFSSKCSKIDNKWSSHEKIIWFMNKKYWYNKAVLCLICELKNEICSHHHIIEGIKDIFSRPTFWFRVTDQDKLFRGSTIY